MDLGLAGRVAAVAAASRGIGRAAAEALAAEGCDVAICARRPEPLEEAAASLRRHGGRVHAMTLDVGAPGAAERFVAEAADVLGRLDIVVANIGGPPSGSFESLDDDEFRRVLEANFMTHVRLARAAIPHMRARRWGRILNVASASIRTPIPGLMTGNAARAAIAGWAKTLSYEVGGDGITVNTIAPEAVLTDRIRDLARQVAERAGMPYEQALEGFTHTPLGRAGRPEEVGALIAYLASDHAGFITGATVAIDGGSGRALF